MKERSDLFHSALTAQQKQEYLAAIKDYETILTQEGENLKKLPPSFRNAGLFSNLGSCYKGLYDYSTAIHFYQLAIVSDPKLHLALINLSTILLAQNKPLDAYHVLQKIPSDTPNASEWYNNLGLAFDSLGEYDKAFDAFTRSLQANSLNHETDKNFAIALLRKGDYQEGWKKYWFRQTRDDHYFSKTSFHQPTYLPAELTDKSILLLREQGIGDEICFLRFVSILKQRGARVIYNPSEKLYPLLKEHPLIDQLISTDLIDKTPADFILPLGDLPYALKCENSIDVPAPFKLTADPVLISDVKAIFASLPFKHTIAITWRAGTQMNPREIELEPLLKEIKNLDANVIILQKEIKKEEQKLLNRYLARRYLDLSHLWNDLPRLSALLFSLDDYIGVDNTNHHLMTSLHRPNTLLLRGMGDFRWMGGESTPWAPYTIINRL